MRAALVVALVIGCACPEPTTFPERICNGPSGGDAPEACTAANLSPMRAGVACQSMQWQGRDVMGCTEWDGHHTVTFGGPDHEVTLSDLGPRWGTIGAWHRVPTGAAGGWCEDRCDGAAR